MSNKEILKKALQKAVENGFKPITPYPLWSESATVQEPFDLDKAVRYPQLFIFNCDFAKALWGDYTEQERAMFAAQSVAVEAIQQPAWQHHLQQMVIADDPIKYLGANI